MRSGITFLFLTGFSSAMLSPNPVIKTMAQGMSLLKPIFAAEAQLQAAILGVNVDEDSIRSEVEALKKANKVLIYTYALSPFSSEAVALLEGSGYEYSEIQLGAEWFLLGPKASVTRVVLSKEVENGATSLPKVFIGGKCIGGCAELASLVDNGELPGLLTKARVPRRATSGK
jgi:glutaredoxin